MLHFQYQPLHINGEDVTVSVVIRCYNEEKYIGRLLEGVLQQTSNDVDIVVVDSGSTDSTVSIVTGYPVKLLTIKPKDFSFGRSLNIGCHAATGEFIVIASAHVYPTYKDWLERLLAPFEDPQVALTYGKQRGNEITKFSEHQVLAKWFPDSSNLRQDHPFCNNANAAIRRSLWEKIKYDETLTGLEDTDWARRAREMGHRIAYVAEAEIVHVHHETSKQIYNRYRREAIALKRIFPEERFGLWDFCSLYFANTLSDFRHAWHVGEFWENLGSVLGFRLMQFWGTYRGFSRRGPVTSQLKQTFYYPNHRTTSGSGSDEAESNRLVQYSDDAAEQRADSRP